MRLWHYKLLQFLPDAQFKGQLRELVAIKRDWESKGTTNHLLINQVMQYTKSELYWYFTEYEDLYFERYGKHLTEHLGEFGRFGNYGSDSLDIKTPLYNGWHNTEYLRVCMANLYEKHHFGIGKSRITDEEWKILLDGYKAITGKEYKI